MSRSAIILLRLFFGVLCIPAVALLLLSPFVFDNPAARDNVLARNFAYAPLVYIILYAFSLGGGRASGNSTGASRAELIRTLLPLAGIAWYGLAIALLQVACGGSFGCR
jgi:hypothetical protein